MPNSHYDRRYDFAVILVEWTTAIVLIALSLAAWFLNMEPYSVTNSFGTLATILAGRIVGLAILVGLPFCRPFLAIGTGFVLWTITIAGILGLTSICSTC